MLKVYIRHAPVIIPLKVYNILIVPCQACHALIGVTSEYLRQPASPHLDRICTVLSADPLAKPSAPLTMLASKDEVSVRA